MSTTCEDCTARPVSVNIRYHQQCCIHIRVLSAVTFDFHHFVMHECVHVLNSILHKYHLMLHNNFDNNANFFTQYYNNYKRKFNAGGAINIDFCYIKISL